MAGSWSATKCSESDYRDPHGLLIIDARGQKWQRRELAGAGTRLRNGVISQSVSGLRQRCSTKCLIPYA